MHRRLAKNSGDMTVALHGHYSLLLQLLVNRPKHTTIMDDHGENIACKESCTQKLLHVGTACGKIKAGQRRLAKPGV